MRDPHRLRWRELTGVALVGPRHPRTEGRTDLATIRHAGPQSLAREHAGPLTYRTYRRPHRRQACYGEFLMPSFHQPRPRPGLLDRPSSSMEELAVARALSELAGLTRRLGYGAQTSSSRAAMPRSATCGGLWSRAGRTVRRRRHGPGGRAGARRSSRRTHNPIDLLRDCERLPTRHGRPMCLRLSP